MPLGLDDCLGPEGLIPEPRDDGHRRLRIDLRDEQILLDRAEVDPGPYRYLGCLAFHLDREREALGRAVGLDPRNDHLAQAGPVR